MSITSIPISRIISSHFDLDVSYSKGYINLLMHLKNRPYTTTSLPHTYTVLKKMIPSVFMCECINEKKLPFSEEVKNTEVGHLLEHLILEHLYRLKFSHLSSNTSFSGFTRWDWKKDKAGTFHIEVILKQEEMFLFHKALIQSCDILNTILFFHKNKNLKKDGLGSLEN